MAENEFEKSVRRAMDEFKIHPSDDVWQNVEERIREKNRKRRILFLLFCFLGLVIAGSGFYIFSNNQTGDLNDKSKNSQQPQMPVGTSNSPAKNDNSKINVPQETAIGQQLVRAQTVDQKNSKRESKTRIGNNDTAGRLVNTENLKATNSLSANKKQEERSETNKQKLNDVSLNNTKILSDTENRKVVASEIQKNTESNISSDTAQVKNKENKPTESAVKTNNPKYKEKKSMKLTWGLNFSAGSSRLSEDLFSFNGSSASGSYPPASQGTGSPGGANTLHSIESKAGFAFKAGAMIKENFTQRSSLSLGLNYIYYSDKIKVGTQQNASLVLFGAYNVSSYYAASPQKDFTEHFHFIELPILYSWRMSQNESHFLSLDAGISIAYLMSTNALVYDTAASGIYYYNKDLITKTHFNIISGISYHLINSKGLEFAVGPQFSFDLTKTIKSDFDKRNYFLYAGIGASLFFEKNKK